MLVRPKVRPRKSPTLTLTSSLPRPRKAVPSLFCSSSGRRKAERFERSKTRACVWGAGQPARAARLAAHPALELGAGRLLHHGHRNPIRTSVGCVAQTIPECVVVVRACPSWCWFRLSAHLENFVLRNLFSRNLFVRTGADAGAAPQVRAASARRLPLRAARGAAGGVAGNVPRHGDGVAAVLERDGLGARHRLAHLRAPDYPSNARPNLLCPLRRVDCMGIVD